MSASFEPIIGRYMTLELQDRQHRLYFEEAGQGIPLLCLHTAGADGRQYRAILNDPAILANFRVIAFDLPRHGKSSPPAGWQKENYYLTTDAYVGTVIAVVDALELDKPVVMGCSIGGRAVLHLALHHGARFRAAIGLQSGAHAGGDSSAQMTALGVLDRPDIHGGELGAALVAGIMSPTAPTKHKWETLWHYMQAGPGVFAGDLYYYWDEGDLRNRIAPGGVPETCPLHLLSGEYDMSAPPSAAREVAALFPNSTFQEMERLGHFPMSEDPDHFLTYLRPVLSAILAGRRKMTDQWDNFIGGETVQPATRTYLEASHPVTGAAGARVAASSGADVEAAVVAAAAGAAAWRDRRPIERGRVLHAIAVAIRAQAADLARIEAAETGKPGWHAAMEVEVAAQYFEFYAGLVNLFQGEKIDLGAAYHSYTVREPLGVIGVITPWNAPLNQAARGIAPALAAGNTVIAKPSEFTSGTTVAVARIAVETCGLPAGVWNVVLGSGAEAGAALVGHPKVRKIAFTGSVRAGREIARVAADRLIPLTLELGGKSPNIVFADADLAQAIPGAIRAFAINAGQVCLAGTRLLVEQSIHDVFVEQLAKAVDDLAVGPGPAAFVGPITTRAQYDKVRDYIAIAESEGAERIAGTLPAGEDWGNGWYVRPTVFAGVTNQMRIAREEVFGPVLAVIPFASEEEAIAIANDTEYGLAAGIWTQNLSRAHRVAAAIQAGQIYVNEYMAGGVETPLGGYKNSGYGRGKRHRSAASLHPAQMRHDQAVKNWQAVKSSQTVRNER